MNSKTIIINSLKDLYKYIPEYESNYVYYRGQVNSDWNLLPTILRNNNLSEAQKFEKTLLLNYLLHPIEEYNFYNNPIEFLMNFQHFGIPTRLIDFTSDIFIALFFACFDQEEKHLDKNGKLFLIFEKQFPKYKINKLNVLNENNITEELNNIINIDEFYILNPQIRNPKMRYQSGIFLTNPLLPISLDNPEKPADLVDFIKIKNKNLNLPNDNCFAVLTFEIPSQSKKKILLELDNNFNINYENIIVKNEKINSIENAFNNLMKNIKNFF